MVAEKDAPKLITETAQEREIRLNSAWQTKLEDAQEADWNQVREMLPVKLVDIPEDGSTNPKAAHGALKAGFGLTSPLADIQYNCVMAGGAYKYGPFNFRETNIDARTYIAAIKRHLALWEDGEDTDDLEENGSGMSHLAHIMACCSLALDAQLTGHFVDNRSKTGLVKGMLKKSAACLNEFTERWDAR